ncbi:MAG: MazG family protein [Actinobacteria bacterium]|nr:MazG family protein [Actinomycetota bacterium]MBO0786317.1 MazG family protein [Actinomycetota bacterium]
MTGRVVLLVTTPTVRPGLLTWRAWRELDQAARVLAGTAEHPLLPALAEAGIGHEVVPDEPGDRLPALLARAAAEAGGGSVVWLCDHGGAEEEPAVRAAAAERLAAAVAAAGSGDASGPGGVRAEVLAGSEDLPGGQLLRLVAVMDRLRVACPWDARQTHASLAPHLIEESYEALEALESGEAAALAQELGDVLLQVMFHARIASERTDGTGYTIDDVADGIVSKLVRRHPHVFGDVTVTGADEVKRNWDQIKAAERSRASGAPASALAGVPFGQPALALAAQLQRRAERAGVPAELADLPPDAAQDGEGPALGAELLRLVATARASGLDPELELREAARRYRDRVRAWEQEHSLRAD